MTWNLLCFLISIAGILQSFYRIDHENFDDHKKRFKRRIKITVLFFVLAAIVSLISDFYTKRTDAKKDIVLARSYKQIDSLSGASRILINQIDTLRKENKTAHIEYDDSLKSYSISTNELLAKYGFHVDSLNNTLRKLSDKVIKEIPPTLTIIDNPKIYSKDTFGITQIDLTFELEAFNADAHITEAYYVLIAVKNNKLVDSPLVLPFTAINYSEIIPVTTRLSVYLPIPFGKSGIADTFAIAFNFNYKSKGNYKQTPLRKSYTLTLKPKVSLRTVDNWQFGKVGEYLKKYKIWTKLYDL